MLYQQRLIEALFNTQSANNSDSIAHPHPALSVYNNNYIESGIRALGISYRTIFALLNESDFRKLAYAYLNEYPKTSFDWADYGEHLSEFIFDIDALAQMPFLPELAEIDWRLMHIERARDKAFNAATFSLLQTHNTEHLQFISAPGLQTMDVLFPVQEIYQLVHDESLHNKAENVLETTQADKKLPINKINSLANAAIQLGEYKSIVLWREEYKALFEYTDENSDKAFESMLNNSSIANVLIHFGEDQNAMTNWLQQHIQTKKIVAVVDK